MINKHVNTEELKKQVDVTKLLSFYNFEQIEDQGDWVKAKCVYHNDSNPSFCMRKSDTYFHCWSCPAKGDAITLVMHLDNIPFEDAANKLSGICGYNINEDSRMEYLRSKWLRTEVSVVEKDTLLIENPRLYKLSRWATQAFSKFYAQSRAREYLLERGFSDEAVSKFELGYYPQSGFADVAIRAGASEAELTALGFLTPYGERFSHRLMFPIYNVRGDISAFSGRSLDVGQEPKYTATPTSDYYKKGLFLYGLQNVRLSEPIILVEGNLDCVRLVNMGFNCLAQLGTALTTSQCRLLKSLTSQVILMQDGDDAGQHSLYKGILPLIETGLDVKVAILPDKEDPDTFCKQYGKEGLTHFIARSQSALEHYIVSKFSVGHEKTTLLSECLTSIKKMPESVIKEQYVTQCALTWGYSEQSIKTELRKM